MTQILKNLGIFIICIAVVAVGYYFIKGDGSKASELGADSAVREELINKTQAFIERSNQLQQIQIDPNFFTDATFTSLRSFSTPVPDQTIGRTDIFSDPVAIKAEVLKEVEDSEEEVE